VKRLLAPLGLVVLACAPRSPQAVGDKFVDYYVVEMDQGRALPLTAGLAREKLERELRDVAAIRRQLGSIPADARPDTYYHRVGERDEGGRHVLTYDVTLKHDRDITHRRVMVAVARDGDAWRVVFFQVYEGG
jgi:hypothetical protein